SDGGIFGRSKLGYQVKSNVLPLPAPNRIPSTPVVSPYVFVGDEAFPLLNNLMRPYPGIHLDDEKRIFNYRLSRARRTIENTFGILVARFRILLQTLYMQPEYANDCIKSCIVLHNYVRQHPRSESYYIPAGFVDYENPENGEIIRGIWRALVPADLRQVAKQSTNNYCASSAHYRDTLKQYF
ncbi:unnamed protein product, partial [Allacma fusca]